MNDILIWSDGFVVGSFLALVLLFYVLLAVGLGLSALFTTGERRGYRLRIARTSAGYAIISLVGSLFVAAYMNRSGAIIGPSWIDWMTVPALVLFALGCRQLTRRRSGDRADRQQWSESHRDSSGQVSMK
jgi:hypothetical protein